MWGLWVFPLLAVWLVFGSAAGLAWLRARRKRRGPSIGALIAFPFALLAIPAAGFAMLVLIGNLTQSSDTALYEEVFGYRPAISEDRMLFDDTAAGQEREIFMRAEPTDAERKKLLLIPGAVKSDLTLDQFVARGESRGFTWWLSGTDMYAGFCKSARVQDAHGFRGWREFRFAECLDAGSEFPASANEGKIYVIASGRSN